MGLGNRKYPLASEEVYSQKVVLAAQDDDEKIILDFLAEADIVEILDFTVTQLVAGSSGSATVQYRLMVDRGTDAAVTVKTVAEQIDAAIGTTQTADGIAGVSVLRGEYLLLDVDYDTPASQTGGTLLIAFRYRR